MRYDLHLHSHYSDGTLAPAALVARVAAGGVDVMALTDHDCLDGMAEVAAAADTAGIRLVAGVEISTSWQQMTIHVVGLNVALDDTTLTAGLAQLVERRRERARGIAAKLDKRRIHDAYDGAARYAGGAVIGRTHFARFLVHEGYVASTGQAFKQYLVRGGAAYVPVQWATLAEAVSWINGAGGQAVIAHPTRYKLANGKLRKLLAEFKECGGAAIEVVNGGQGAEVNAHCAKLANEFGLLASVGSDYHGPEQGWLEPGRLAPLPENCVPVWRDWETSP
ncbi:MAG TPA: PHP domain-containing protein [Burkholderiaceae bacterium]|nr:PHP domain-containing protein [Burkholderiaceae bacterium]